MELSEILRTLAVLLTAIIWGGVIVVDFVVTPARFSTPNVDRDSATALGTQIFRTFGYVQLGVGVVAILVVILSGAAIEAIIAAIFLAVFIGAQAGFLEPNMTALRNPSLSPEEIAANEATRQQLHRAYVVADGFKLLLGIILIGILVIQ